MEKRIAIEIEWNEHSRIENYNFQLLEAASIECGGLGGWESERNRVEIDDTIPGDAAAEVEEEGN